MEGASGAARQQILEEIYSAPNDSGGSFSYQVLTKLGGQEAILVASDFDWKDIGTWQEYVKLVPADNRGNYAVGNNVSLDEGSSGNYVANFTGKKVVIEGAEGLLIIHTDNATLIAPKDLSGEKTKELRDTLLTDSRFKTAYTSTGLLLSRHNRANKRPCVSLLKILGLSRSTNHLMR